MRFLSSCLLIVFFAACQPEMRLSDLELYIQQTYSQSANATSQQIPQSAFQPLLFAPKSQRDPFSPSMSLSSGALQDNCLQKNEIPEPELFVNLELSALFLKGIIQENDKRLALILSNNNQLHLVQKGQVIGINRGLIKDIGAQYIAITQYVLNDVKCWKKIDLTLTMDS